MTKRMTPTTPTKDITMPNRLDKPVTIHFKEDSIPGLRRGVLIDESKQYLKALFTELVGEDEALGDKADGGYWMQRDARNKLRATLKTKIKDL